MVKKILTTVMILIMTLFLTSSILAVTGAIGNSRMILNAKAGDTINKYILVRNVNNVTVKIDMFATGDLEKDIVIKDNNFTLTPGQEKKANFTIKVNKEGTTETKINVRFTPVGEKTGIGLSSSITVIAGTGSGDDTNPNPGDSGGDNPITGNPIAGITLPSINPITLALMITALVFVIFIILAVVANSINKKKKSESIGEVNLNLKKKVKRDAEK